MSPPPLSREEKEGEGMGRGEDERGRGEEPALSLKPQGLEGP